MNFARLILFAVLLSQPVVAAEQSAKFSVSNMTCALCPITVKAAISQVQGVLAVEVSRELAQATVRYDDALATVDALAAASTNAGYPAKVIEAP